MLDSRYDDIKNGKVKPIDGDEAFARLRRKSEERHAESSWAGMYFIQGRTTTWMIFGNSSPRIIKAADKVLEDIYTTIGLLVQFPHQGHRRADLTSRPVRFQTVRNYLIAYAPDEKPLLIIAVLHGRRSPRVMAAVLRGREDKP